MSKSNKAVNSHPSFHKYTLINHVKGFLGAKLLARLRLRMSRLGACESLGFSITYREYIYLEEQV